MNILGIETSCDETAAAVVRDGREVLSNVVYTQIPLHQPYGGVVPEIASRAHVEKIGQVVGEAIRQFRASGGTASVRRQEKGRIDAVAVTYGPGLSPALIVGLNAAKGLAKALGVPLVGVNHIEAHLHSPFLFDPADRRESQISDFRFQGSDSVAQGSDLRFQGSDSVTQGSYLRFQGSDSVAQGSDLRFQGSESVAQGSDSVAQDSGLGSQIGEGGFLIADCMPALGLAISGGNTMWVDMPEYGKYEVVGETLDDAAGEAFDKAAKLLGLGYPGGLKMDRISAAWREEAKAKGEGGQWSDLIPFPKGRPREGVTALAGLPAELCVSFSGLKTALLRYSQKHPDLIGSKEGARDFGGYEVTPQVAQVVASYQEAIAQAVADRSRTALKRKRYKSFILGGGVSLNSRIRAVLADVARDAGMPLLMAKPKYTGDNGAMIAGLAYYRRNHVEDAMTLDANPSLAVGG